MSSDYMFGRHVSFCLFLVSLCLRAIMESRWKSKGFGLSGEGDLMSAPLENQIEVNDMLLA